MGHATFRRNPDIADHRKGAIQHNGVAPHIAKPDNAPYNSAKRGVTGYINMKLYLHIGGPKTGTTSFQAALASTGALDGTKFWTPHIGQVAKGGHHILVRNLIGIHDQPRRWADPLAALKELAASQTGPAIISSEYCDRLASRHPAVFTRLLERLSLVFDDITIVRVWRDMTTLSSSRYQQSLCNFDHNHTFGAYFEECLRMERHQLRAMMAGYAPASQHINVAYRDQDDTFDSIVAVGNAIGITLKVMRPSEAPAPILNTSRTLAQVAATKWLIDETGMNPRGIPILHCRLLHNFIRDGVAARGGDANRFQGATAELIARSRAQNHKLRDEFAARFWGQSWDDATARTTNMKPCNLSPEHLPPESAAIARDIVDELKLELPQILATPTKRKDHGLTKAAQEARLLGMNETAARRARSGIGAQRRLVLHVGGHRTGTTSFQELLTPDAPYLEQSDISTPDLGQGQDGAHHHLIYRLIGAASCIDDRDALNELRGLAAMERRTCLISSEFIHHLMIFQPSVFRALIQSLHTIFDKIEIVQVIRETASLINSRYQQTLCNFTHNDDFASYALRYLQSERRLLSRTLSRFGIASSGDGLSFVALPYQPHLTGFDAIGLVADAVGLTTPPSAPRKAEPRALERMAVSSHLMTFSTTPLSQMVHSQRFALQTAVSAAVSREPAAVQRPVSFQGLDAALLAEVTAANAPLRDRFAKTFWGTTWAETFGAPELTPYQAFADTDLPRPIREHIARAVNEVTGLIPTITGTPPRAPWDVTITSQYAQLAKLNQAARAQEQPPKT